MNSFRSVVTLLLILLCLPMNGLAEEEPVLPALVSTMDPTDLLEFEQQPEVIQNLIHSALELTRMKLTYRYGSNDPKNGGMDCSGTIHHLLRKNGISDVPRQSDLIYEWVKTRSGLKAERILSEEDPKLRALRPGDLLFWSGTYNIDRKITHVMIYLGTDINTGKPVMFGSSSDRRHRNKRQRGVSLFDFTLPQGNKRSKFEGFGVIPGLPIKAAANEDGAS
jgi:hypothetical protein